MDIKNINHSSGTVAWNNSWIQYLEIKKMRIKKIIVIFTMSYITMAWAMHIPHFLSFYLTKQCFVQDNLFCSFGVSNENTLKIGENDLMGLNVNITVSGL